MRFAGPDVVLFVVGLLMVGGSAYGLYQEDAFSGGGSAFDVYTLTWTSVEEDTVVANFDTENTVPFNFTVGATGVTLVTVTVDCSHAASVPEEVSTAVAVDVTGPNGLTGSQSGSCGETLQVEIPVEDTPKGGVVEAGSQEEAEKAATEIVGSNATGEWTGEVRFTSQDGGAGSVFQLEYTGDVTAGIVRAVPHAEPMTTR